MGIHKDRPSKTGGFAPGSPSLSANALNQMGQYIDQSRVGIHSGNVRPSETAGGTLIEVDVGRRRASVAVATYHPWKIVTFIKDPPEGSPPETKGILSFYVWPATVCNLSPKFMGERLDKAEKPSRPVTEGTYHVWLEVKGQGSGNNYSFPVEDGESPLIVVDQQTSKGSYDDKAYLKIGSIEYKKAVEGVDGEYEDEEEVLNVTQLRVDSVWVERLKCGDGTAAVYFWD